MLHWIKVAFWVLCTLIIMRVLSWLPMWIVTKATKPVRWKSVFLSNSIAPILFLVFLWSQMLPGEPLDIAATVFGILVYIGFSIIDLFWLPWECSRIK